MPWNRPEGVMACRETILKSFAVRASSMLDGQAVEVHTGRPSQGRVVFGFS